MNPKAVGELSEGLILAKLLSNGYAVSLPFGNNQRYDLIVDDSGKLLRVQCKTGRLENGSVKSKVCSINGFTGAKRSYHGEVELIIVYCPDNGKFYKVPIKHCGINEITLRIESSKNNQSKNVRWARDFEMP